MRYKDGPMGPQRSAIKRTERSIGRVLVVRICVYSLAKEIDVTKK